VVFYEAMIEKANFHPEKLAYALDQNFLNRGIKLLLVDLDDVVFQTHEMYDARIREVSELLETQLEASQDQIYEMIIQTIQNIRPSLKVNPLTTPTAVAEVFFNLNQDTGNQHLLTQA
jgi:Mrp family chromosome partitioning ATPase